MPYTQLGYLFLLQSYEFVNLMLLFFKPTKCRQLKNHVLNQNLACCSLCTWTLSLKCKNVIQIGPVAVSSKHLWGLHVIAWGLGSAELRSYSRAAIFWNVCKKSMPAAGVLSAVEKTASKARVYPIEPHGKSLWSTSHLAAGDFIWQPWNAAAVLT